MWKILLGFIVFAGLGLFMIFKGGDKVDMSGEKHDAGIHTEAPAASPANPAASAAVLVPATPASASAPAPLAAAASAASASK
jgi:hypothetical protein